MGTLAGRTTLSIEAATGRDAPALARLSALVARNLTTRFGPGHWSLSTPLEGVRRQIRTSCVLVARRNGRAVATARLTRTKPWSIRPSHFRKVARPVYLTNVVVQPALQGRGVGRRVLQHAIEVARAWPCDAIRLDVYDGPAGASGFYRRLGFRAVGRTTYRKTPLVYYELLLSP